MKKKNLLLLAASMFLLSGCGTSSNPGYTPEHLASDPVIKEGKAIDGVLDEGFYAKTPYVAKSEYANRDKNKYEHLRNLPDCTSSTYVGYGEEGLFVYCENDDPIVNLQCPEIFNRTGYELYICSPDADSVDNTLVEVTVGPDGALLIRQRRENNTKWVRIPAMESVARGIVKEVGYSVEVYLPYSVLNISSKIDHVGVCVAMIRLDTTSEYQNHYCWELLEMYTKTRSHTKIDTFPQFDVNGCKPEGDGDTFANPHNACIDVAYDRGDNPHVDFKHKATNLECYIKDEKYLTTDFYWHSTLKITSFFKGDDPRIGIFVKSKPLDNGFFSMGINFMELDKAGGADGNTITIKDVGFVNRIRDDSQGTVKTWNDWTNCIRSLVDSAVDENYTFDLGIYRNGKTIKMYINDTLISYRSDLPFIDENTELTCGLISWYGGGTFSGYELITENVEEYMAKKSKMLAPDPYVFPQTMDFIKGDTIYTKSTKNLNGIVNVNKELTGKSYLKDTLSFVDTPATHLNPDDRAGFVITDLTSTGDRYRYFFLLKGDYVNHGGKVTEFNAYYVVNDKLTWTDTMNLQKYVDVTGLTRENEMSLYIDGTQVKVLINGEKLFDMDLASKNLGDKYMVGFTSWKSYSTFSDIDFAMGDEATTKYNQDIAK